LVRFVFFGFGLHGRSWGDWLGIDCGRGTGGWSGLELSKGVVGALVLAMQAGLVAGEESQRGGPVGKRAEGLSHVDGRIGPDELLFDFRLAEDHLALNEDGLHGTGAVDAPAGGDHIVDQILLDWVNRPVDGGVFLTKLLEFLGIFRFQQDGVTGSESMAQGIPGRFFTRSCGFRALGFRSVGPCGV
jgi:hypothetical protein